MAVAKRKINYAAGTAAGALAGSSSIRNAANSSSSSKSSSSSSSKSSSSASKGTVINGVTYGTGYGGYQTDINNAVANGDYKLAAQLEQARNNVIASTGSSYAQTNNYSGWLDDTDYGAIGKQQMATGASAEDVYQTYLNRYNKANGTIGLQQYANDAIQQEMWDYIQANLNKPTFNLEEYLSSMPTYNSQYSSRIDDMLNKILNRDKFSYTAADDPLYQQYASMYNREGNRAMNDTLAAAAANAGGMNSYAVTAAQQANNYYNAQLGDKIPELYQLAYSMYMDDIDNQVRDLGLLQDMDSTQYSRYRDTMNDWRNDLDFAYNMYRDDMGDWQWNKNFNYNAERDDISDARYNQEWEYSVGRDAVDDERYAQETAYERAMDFLNAGIMPDKSVLDAAGISQNEAANVIAAYKLANASSGGSSSGGSSSGGGSGGGNDDYDEPSSSGGGGANTATIGAITAGVIGSANAANYAPAQPDWSSALALGLGPVSASFIVELENAGAVIEDSNGSVRWAPGWSKDNYKEKMNKLSNPFGTFTLK